MHYFTQVLHVEDHGFLFFGFNNILSPAKNKYHVTVWTRGPQCHHFMMEENFGRWKINKAPLPPQWILNLESQLDEVIRQQQKQGVTERNHFKLLRLPGYVLKTGS